MGEGGQVEVGDNGRFHILHAEGDLFAFARSLDDTTLITAVNVATSPVTFNLPVSDFWPDGVPVQSLFGPAVDTAVSSGVIHLTLPARSGIVLATG